MIGASLGYNSMITNYFYNDYKIIFHKLLQSKKVSPEDMNSKSQNGIDLSNGSQSGEKTDGARMQADVKEFLSDNETKEVKSQCQGRLDKRAICSLCDLVFGLFLIFTTFIVHIVFMS